MSGRAHQKGRGTVCKEWQRLLVLFALSVCLYANTVFGEFVFDDHQTVLNNPDVRLDTPISNLFEHDYWGMSLSHPDSHKSYRPLTTLTFKWNNQLHGLEPFGYHLVNVLLHSFVCALLYHVLSHGVGVANDVSFMASLLFIVHPIHTEAVANITGRAEMLSSIFYLLAISSFLTFLKTYDGGRSYNVITYSSWWAFTCVICIPFFAMASMLCKEQGITCIAVCLLYYLIIYQSGSLNIYRNQFVFHLFTKSNFIIPVTLISLSVGLLMFRLSIMQGQPLVFSPSDNPASFSDSNLTKILTYAYLSAFNFWLFLCPSHLCFDWSMESIPLVESLRDTRNVCTVCVFCLLASVGMSGFTNNVTCSNQRQQRVKHEGAKFPSITTKQTVTFALILLIVPFLPVSNIFFPIGFVIAERVLYLPSMGFCLLVGTGISLLQQKEVWQFLRMSYRVSTLPVTSIFYGLLLLLSVKTIIRNAEWTNAHSLALSGIKYNPLNAKVYATLGNILVVKGDRQCEMYYREALRIKPNYTMVWSNLGLVLLNTDRPQEAEACYQRALSIQSNHVNANTNMGHLCRLQNRWKEALKHFTVASDHAPHMPVLHYMIGTVCVELDYKEEAIIRFTTALKLNPNYHEAHVALGMLLSRNGNDKEAIPHLLKALELSPDSIEAHIGLASLLMEQGNFSEAESHLLFSLNLSTNNMLALNELAKLYKMTGETAKAKEIEQN